MSDFPTLDNFLAAYFHQDWMLDHDSARAVVDDYADGESEATVGRLRGELDALLASDADEARLAALLRDNGCEYDPARDGLGYRQWLESVRAQLTA